MQIQDAVVEFLEYLRFELNRSELTCKGYRADLQIFAGFLEGQGLGQGELASLTGELLGEYLRYLTRVRGNKANTLRRRITTLQSFCRFLVDSAYLEHSPAENLPRIRRPQQQPRYLQRQEVEQLFAVVDGGQSPSSLRDQAILYFIYYSGVRVAELVSLRRENVDLQKDSVKIHQGKGNRFRQVPLHGRLKAQLQKYLDGAPELAAGALFCNRQGDPLSADYVHHMIADYAAKAGLHKNVTPHMLRHSFATHLYREDVDIQTLGKLLGHEGIRTTSVYIHTDLKHLRAGVERLPTSRKLAAILFGDGKPGQPES